MTSTTVAAPKRILVLNATTQQGLSVVRALAALNDAASSRAVSNAAHQATPAHPTTATATAALFRILAQTSRTTSHRAKALERLNGVTLLKAPNEDVEMIFSAAKLLDVPARLETTMQLSESEPEQEQSEERGAAGIWGVFSVQKTREEPGGLMREVRCGKEVADLAVKTGVEMFVYSSVNFGTIPDRKTGVPQFEAKRLIEEHLEGLEEANPGFNVTVLRPAAFFDTFNPHAGLPARLMIAALRSGVRGSVKMMACDLGIFASLAFSQPETYAGVRLNLAGDELTLEEMERQLVESKGEALPASWAWCGWLVARFNREAASVIYFLNRHGQTADLAKLRKLHPGLKTWKEYVETEYGKH